MIDILYIKNEEQLSLECIDLIEGLIGSSEKEKGRRYKRWQDRQAYLLGKFLLSRLLAKNGYSANLLQQLQYTHFNRPFIDQEKFDFNISHSGALVICAFSTSQAIGIDIEQIQQVKLEDFSYILSQRDKERIKNSLNPYNSFFKIWSTKEAILKADGCGLVDDLDQLEIDEGTSTFKGTRYYLKELEISANYASCMASPAPVEKVNIAEVFADDCLVQGK